GALRFDERYCAAARLSSGRYKDSATRWIFARGDAPAGLHQSDTISAIHGPAKRRAFFDSEEAHSRIIGASRTGRRKKTCESIFKRNVAAAGIGGRAAE